MSTTATASPKAQEAPGFQGNDKLLLGIVLAVMGFWLFAGTAGTVAPAIMEDTGIDATNMNFAVSITALMSGLLIVLMGGIADKVGRVKITLFGIIMNFVGSLLLIFASGALALPLLFAGRALQGFGAACIMPASMALVKAYWDGPGRQRAVSMWSIGSWGGSGLAALFGGAVVQFIGWRGIFAISAGVAALAFLLIVGTPENAPAKGHKAKFDYLGLFLFIIGTLGFLLALIFGNQIGWTSPLGLGLLGTGVVTYTVFYLWERKQESPIVDFSLFKNTTFIGATISNFLINCTIGLLMVSQQLIQLAGHKADGELYSAWDAGLLTIGYGIFIIAFIRFGEKLLQRYGPRKPMIWARLIVAVVCLLLMQTQVLIGRYVILAVVAYCLFGLGLAFYATPSTDAALSNLPADKAGSGSGIYKMASSLGAAIGAAVSLSIFSSMSGGDGTIVGEIIQMTGRTDNAALREAAMVAIGVNLVFTLLAIISITMTVPKGGGSRDVGAVAESAAPAPQLPPDDAKAAVLARLGELSLEDLERIEKQAYLSELGKLDQDVLKALVQTKRE